MKNVMKTEFSALAENEAFARATAASFIMPLDPTVEELTEVKTAVSEAVSNSIIHGYGGCEDKASERVIMECAVFENGKVVITIEDEGVGIEDVEKAREPLFSTGDSEERSGMGFTVMESFMDKVKVKSEKGKGTTVILTKYLDVVSDL
ncbi:MAG: anti-sigma F factor [Bacillota bacterium]|nr:anti-sigma F factor [Bacillota bacterium]